MTHSSVLVKYAAQSDPAVLWKLMPRQSVSGRGPPERHSTRYMCFVSSPPQRGPLPPEDRPEAAPATPERGRTPRRQERHLSEVSGRSVPGRLFGLVLRIIAIIDWFWPPRPQCGCCRSRPERGGGSASGAKTHGWRRASLLQHLVSEVPPTMLERLISSEYA